MHIFCTAHWHDLRWTDGRLAHPALPKTRAETPVLHRNLDNNTPIRWSKRPPKQIVEMQRGQNLQEIEFRDLDQLAMVQADFGDPGQARQTAATLQSSKTQDVLT
jgi:hypothetical protein